METPSHKLDNAQLVLLTPIDRRHRAMQNCRHVVHGQMLGPARGLAICRYNGDPGFYLFYCDDQWNVLADTWHDSLAAARSQAEFEYEGVADTWCSLDP